MKAIDIALKDLLSAFRSAFAIIFMFGVPLLVTGMFYFMFGNTGGEQGFDVAKTKVIVANLDQGNRMFRDSVSNFENRTQADTLGEVLVEALESEDFAELISVTFAKDAETARRAVDEQQAGVAIIIPADFSTQFADQDGEATIELYPDPTLTLGPEIIRSVLNGFSDGISGAKIAVDLTIEGASTIDPVVIGQVMQEYGELQPEGDLVDSLMEVRAPHSEAKSENMIVSILSPIMGGMLIFYAFFTSTSTAQTILQEDENGTLARLFTTPTPQATILTGKFLSVFLTVLVQVGVLLTAAHFIFQIEWGSIGLVSLFVIGTVITASAFGIFVNSLIKNTKQGGLLFGGVVTLTGMVGMMPIFTLSSPNRSNWIDMAALFVPQGWAIRTLFQAMKGADLTDIGLSVVVLFIWGAVFFSVGVWRFKKRYT